MIPGLATYFRFSFPFFKKGSCQFWRKYVHEVLVIRLGGLSLPRKSVVRLTDRPDMTLDVYVDVKQQYNKYNNNVYSHTNINIQLKNNGYIKFTEEQKHARLVYRYSYGNTITSHIPASMPKKGTDGHTQILTKLLRQTVGIPMCASLKDDLLFYAMKEIS